MMKVTKIFFCCAFLAAFGLENLIASELNDFIDRPLEPKQKCYYSAVKRCEEACGTDNWTARSDCAENVPSRLGTPPKTLRCYCKKPVQK